jgi:hypothetical protein
VEASSNEVTVAREKGWREFRRGRSNCSHNHHHWYCSYQVSTSRQPLKPALRHALVVKTELKSPFPAQYPVHVPHKYHPSQPALHFPLFAPRKYSRVTWPQPPPCELLNSTTIRPHFRFSGIQPTPLLFDIPGVWPGASALPLSLVLSRPPHLSCLLRPC